MNWSVEMEVQGDILIATVTGDLKEGDYRAARDKVCSYIKENKVHNVLFDVRQAVLHISTIGIFSIAASYPEVIPPGTMYTIVYSSKSLPAADFIFYENVARNRGACLKVFSDIVEAKQWLIAESCGTLNGNEQKK